MFEYPYSPSIFYLTLLRHGQSVGNATFHHQGQTDYALTETGRQQAQALADRWLAEAVSFDYAIASPLARASQTAEIIAQTLGLEIEYDPLWMERDSGVIAGLSHQEAARRYPQPPFLSMFDPIGLRGESEWELYLRAGQAVQKLLRRRPGRYLIVSHGGLLNKVLYVCLGIVPQANFHGANFSFQNTSFANLVYNPASQVWVLERVNDHLHWMNDDSD